MFHRLTCSVSSEVCNPSCFRSYYSNHNVVSSWLLLYVFTKAKHKTHEMTTQIQKDDSYCFDDVMQLRALPDIAHAGLSAVALDVKKQQTANSTEYFRIHPVRSHSVSVVTRAHNTGSYDVDHGCTSTFRRPRLIAAVNMQISQTATTVAVVFELFSTKQEKLIEIGWHCVHTSLVFSEAFKKQNPVFR